MSNFTILVQYNEDDSLGVCTSMLYLFVALIVLAA